MLRTCITDKSHPNSCQYPLINYLVLKAWLLCCFHLHLLLSPSKNKEFVNIWNEVFRRQRIFPFFANPDTLSFDYQHIIGGLDWRSKVRSFAKKNFSEKKTVSQREIGNSSIIEWIIYLFILRRDDVIWREKIMATLCNSKEKVRRFPNQKIVDVRSKINVNRFIKEFIKFFHDFFREFFSVRQLKKKS